MLRANVEIIPLQHVGGVNKLGTWRQLARTRVRRLSDTSETFTAPDLAHTIACRWLYNQR